MPDIWILVDNTNFFFSQDLNDFVSQTTDKVKYLNTSGLTLVVHVFFLLLLTLINLSRHNASKTFYMIFSAKQ